MAVVQIFGITGHISGLKFHTFLKGKNQNAKREKLARGAAEE